MSSGIANSPPASPPDTEPLATLQLVNEQMGASTASPQLGTIEIDVPQAAVRGVAWLAGTHGLNQVLAFGVFVVLGRLLSPREFGLVAAANVVILFLRLFVTAGMSRGLIRREELSRSHADTAFWVSMASGVALAAATLAAAPLVADLFGQPGLTDVVRALSPVFVLAALDGTQSALVDRSMSFRVQAIRRSGATLIGSAVAVALALAGAGVWSLVGQTLSYELVLVVGLWSMTTWRPSLALSRRCLSELLSFGTNYLGVKVMIYLSQNVDNFLVGWILGPVELGLYVIAYRVLIVVAEVLLMTIDQVALPLFSRFQRDPERLEEAFYSAVELGVTVGWPAFAGLAVLADQVIPLVFGSKWAGSGPVMTSLALAGMVQVATTFTQNLVIAIGMVAREFRWNLLATAMQLAGFAVAAHFGIVAVATALAATTGALWPVRIWQVSRWSGIHPGRYARRLVGPAVATILMACAVLVAKRALADAEPGISLPVEIAVGALVYVAALPLVARSAFRGLLRSAALARG